MDNHFFADYVERLENLHSELGKALEALPDEAVDWAPASEMNSVAVLLAHMAGSLRFWIGDIALGEDSGRDREAEFQTRGVSSDEMLARLEAVIDYARSGLPRLSLDDLQKSRHTREGKTVTCGWALLHALEHAYLHLGHIQLTSQLWNDQSTSNRH